MKISSDIGDRLTGPAATERFIDLLTGSSDSELAFRTFCDDKTREAPAQNFIGTLAGVGNEFDRAQSNGYGVFAIVNGGGHCDAQISEVRAAFIDADNVPLDGIEWHLKPDFIVQRDATHWHAYWLANEIAVHEFSTIQKRLAQRYGTDKCVFNPSRVMRLPGYLHLKDKANPHSVTLIDLTGGALGDCYRALNGYSAESVCVGLPELEVVSEGGVRPSARGTPVTLDHFRKVLSYVDPTMKGEHQKWFGVTRAILDGQLPIIAPDDTDWTQLADNFNSGELWRARTGDSDFVVSTYFGRDEMLRSAAGRARETGPVITLGTFYQMARAGGYNGLVSDEMELFDALNSTFPTNGEAMESSGTFPRNDYDCDAPLSAAQLKAGSYPPPEFVVDGLIVKGEVNLLYGDGGVGKTTLAMQLAVGIAMGDQVLGFHTERTPALLVLAEDGKGEVKRRLETICDHLQVDLGSLPLTVWARPTFDPVLAEVTDVGVIREGPFMPRLRDEIRKIGPCLVVLDSLADFAIVDEIKRQPVNALLKRVFGGLCQEFGVTLLVLGHPSKTGMNDGTYYSGSTAFNNAVRNRLVLSQDKDDPLGLKRTLEVAKSNYAPCRETDLYFANGVFLNASGAKAQERTEADRTLVFTAVKEVLEKGEQVVHTNGSGLHPQDIAAQIWERHGRKLSAKQVRDHLSALRMNGRLRYQNADNSKRNHRAGYVLPDAA
jgi:RecA-family ATPase